MTIITESRTVSISLRYWHGGQNAGYDPDCFHDVEVAFANNHDKAEGSNDYVATDVEVDELVEWWEEECKTANAGYDHGQYIDDEDYAQYGPVGVILFALTDEQRSRGDEWVLTVD